MINILKDKIVTSALVPLLLAATLSSSICLGFGIAADDFGQPIHETLTMKAATDSGFILDAQSPQMKHLVEGVRFNDDPEGYLLDGAMPAGEGGALALALEFIGFGKDRKHRDPTKASHFGNFQFLHAMGKSSESAANIKTKIILYAAHCYRMATEADSLDHFTKDYAAVTEQAKSPQLNFRYTRGQLIAKKAIELFPKEVLFFHAGNQMEFQYRALGSLLHVVQDSYAKGHTVREGWDSGDNSGNIIYFQDYSQQDSGHHEEYDEVKRGKKVSGDSVMQIPGAKIAYERSKKILEMVKNDCPWTSDELDVGSACAQSMMSLLNNDIFKFNSSSDSKEMQTRSHPELVPQDPDPNGFKIGG